MINKSLLKKHAVSWSLIIEASETVLGCFALSLSVYSRVMCLGISMLSFVSCCKCRWSIYYNKTNTILDFKFRICIHNSCNLVKDNYQFILKSIKINPWLYLWNSSFSFSTAYFLFKNYITIISQFNTHVYYSEITRSYVC